MIDRLTLSDQVAAALLSGTRSRHIVLALVERDRSQSELSVALGIPLNLLRYHLDRLVAAGLVVVARSEKRRGRPIRFYRAIACSFFIPAELTPPVPSRPLMEELRQALENSRAGTYSGILYSCQDGPRMQIVRAEQAGRPAAELWHRLCLSDQDARALIEELRLLFARFESRDTGAGQRFVSLAALAPLPA
jgi:DNA-binding transcriptional ArsR family regulator